MPAFPPAALDDVEIQNQRYHGTVGQGFLASLSRNNDGVNVLIERERNSAANMSKAVDAFVIQAVLGTNPSLADYTLAMRATRDQPQTVGSLVSPGVVSGQPAAGNTVPAQPTK
jgi:hypothetical protein